MTPREIRHLLLQMTGKRAAIREYRAQHADWMIEPDPLAQMHGLNAMTRHVEQSLPDFTVEFIEEKDSYCLVPRLFLPEEKKVSS